MRKTSAIPKPTTHTVPMFLPPTQQAVRACSGVLNQTIGMAVRFHADPQPEAGATWYSRSTKSRAPPPAAFRARHFFRSPITPQKMGRCRGHGPKRTGGALAWLPKFGGITKRIRVWGLELWRLTMTLNFDVQSARCVFPRRASQVPGDRLFFAGLRQTHYNRRGCYFGNRRRGNTFRATLTFKI